MVDPSMAASSPNTPSAVAPDAAQRGIYIDFRAVRGNPPALLGLLVEEDFDQVVFDTQYADAALAAELRINSLGAEVGALLARARTEERLVFVFSSGSLDIVARHHPADADLRRLCRDGQQLGADWCARTAKPARAALSLSGLLRQMGAPRLPHLDSKAATKRLRDVGGMLRSRGAYDALTPVAKAKWTRLLLQSRAQCEGLRTLVLALAEQPGGTCV